MSQLLKKVETQRDITGTVITNEGDIYEVYSYVTSDRSKTWVRINQKWLKPFTPREYPQAFYAIVGNLDKLVKKYQIKAIR